MKLLVIADIADLHWKHGGGHADVVLSCGDVPDQVVLEAARAHGCSKIFAVKGNHDANAPFPAPIADLHLQVQEFQGVTFGGLNGSWRYKPQGHFLYDQEEVEGFLQSYPPVCVFLSHNSPRRLHDKEDEVHFGFDALNTYIRRARPNVMFHGHQHVDKESMLEETRVIAVFEHKLIEI